MVFFLCAMDRITLLKLGGYKLILEKANKEPHRFLSTDELSVVIGMLSGDIAKEMESLEHPTTKEDRDKKLRLISLRLTLVSLPKEMIINPTHGPKLTALVTEINMRLEELTRKG